MTATFTSEFGREFEQERGRWLRRRFLWYCGVMIVLGVITIFFAALAIFGVKPDAPVFGSRTLTTINLVGSIPYLAIYIWAFWKARSSLLSSEAVFRLVYWLIVLAGAMSLGLSVVSIEVGLAELPDEPLSQAVQGFQDGMAERDAGDEPSTLEMPPMHNAAPDTEDTSLPSAPAAANGEAIAAGEQDESSGEVSPQQLREAGATFGALTQIFLTHIFACLFLPWTPRESMKPLIPLFGLYFLIVIYYMPGILAPAATIAFSPLVAAPGLGICWWRHSRFRKRYHLSALRGRYGEMKRELTDARRIHEALFPEPIRDGDVRFDFVYEPMRQIGGDYLYCHRFPGLGDDARREPVSVVIIDVTGHGVPAALTVNRLHGELERLFGEEPDISPGDVLTALNSYVHLTLATHSVYATALCLRVDPRQNTIEWASGGHPPAFVRSIDGRLDRLDSTAFVLGACHGDDFQADQRSMRFLPGDTLIAYTDGATESRDQRGGMLRVEGLQAVIASINPRAVADGGWAGAVLRQVDQRRFGPPADDTLIVEMYRPL